jgi:hypothetical protein
MKLDKPSISIISVPARVALNASRVTVTVFIAASADQRIAIDAVDHTRPTLATIKGLWGGRVALGQAWSLALGLGRHTQLAEGFGRSALWHLLANVLELGMSSTGRRLLDFDANGRHECTGLRAFRNVNGQRCRWTVLFGMNQNHGRGHA